MEQDNNQTPVIPPQQAQTVTNSPDPQSLQLGDVPTPVVVASMEQPNPQPLNQPVPPMLAKPSNNRLLPVLFIAIAVLLALGGGAGYWLTHHHGSQKQTLAPQFSTKPLKLNKDSAISTPTQATAFVITQLAPLEDKYSKAFAPMANTQSDITKTSCSPSSYPAGARPCDITYGFTGSLAGSASNNRQLFMNFFDLVMKDGWEASMEIRTSPTTMGYQKVTKSSDINFNDSASGGPYANITLQKSLSSKVSLSLFIQYIEKIDASKYRVVPVYNNTYILTGSYVY